MIENVMLFDENDNEKKKKLLAELLSALEERLEQKAILLSRQAVAERLHVNVSTLWRWARAGYLTPVRIGRAVWYRECDIERLERGERML